MPARPDLYNKAKEWCIMLSELLAEGKPHTIPTNIFPRGLESVQDGFDYMLGGNVHGEKIVYRIADTPGLHK
jgi:hypothetical protein